MKNFFNNLFRRINSEYHKIDPETDLAWQHLNLDLNNQPNIQKNQVTYFGTKWFNRPALAFSLLSIILLILMTPYAYHYWSTVSITTPYGNQKQVTLPDGSNVHLNSGSSLSYKSGFDKENRNIRFQGEALFTVLPSTQPFIITSGNLKVEVVGTSFNVKNYSDEIEVAVIQGTVLVKQYDSTVTVTGGKRTKFDQDQKPSAPERIVYDNYPGWIHNTFIYEKTELKKVCEEIERAFNIQIELNNSKLESITVTGEIKADNIDETLTILSFLIQKKYKYKNDYYVIY